MASRDENIESLLEELTQEEQLRLVRGREDPAGTATGYLPGVERLEIPEYRLVDGPLGIRAEGKRATAFPASIAVAATFDPTLAQKKGAAMAREAKAHDQDCLLAPGTNLIRIPHCGRNFEYYAEDPVLASRMTEAAVSGIQSEDVVATVKHYVANNQEADRISVSAEIDDRTLRELYLRPFRAAVDADVGSVMTAYNRVNGTHMSDHEYLVTDVLKDEWGFDGYVVSDWYGTESTVGAANAGLDLEMPGVPVDGPIPEPDNESLDAEQKAMLAGLPDGTKAGLFGDSLATAIESEAVSAERVESMVRRILGQLARIGLLDEDGNCDPSARNGELDTPAHRALATEIAARGMVLLENDGVLPLENDTDVAVIGPHIDEAKLGGGGSSETTPFVSSSPLEGITSRASGEVTTARAIQPIPDVSLFDLLPFVGDNEEDSSESAAVSAEFDSEPIADRSIDDAVTAAGEADVAVVFVRDQTTEATDRTDLRLPGAQDELVEAVAAANERTVVVLHTGGPIELPWRDDVAAILEAWYPGQGAGEATASVLFGDRDPSGRLPVTFAPETGYPAREPHQYPGVDGEAHYEEGLFIGYRHFEKNGLEVTYPFGHGHSYATFSYRDGHIVDDRTVGVTVENTAERAGREIVQAYVRPPSGAVDAERPVRELAGFISVELEGGESRTVEIQLDEYALGRYDLEDGWTVDAGSYQIELGRSATETRETVTLPLEGTCSTV